MFHLAIPSRDLEESIGFYQNLGCSIGRQYHEHAIVDFFGHQLVCHRSMFYEREPKMYPRHFGVVISLEKLQDLWKRWEHAKFVFEPYFIRHKGKREEHHTFFLVDPSGNVIEFKWYANKSAILG
jgi:extradiol dioxygenase family protein